MSKKVVKVINLHIPAGKANPAPPIGPALGSAGLNIAEFCKNFNAKTQAQAGQILPVVITVYSDRTYEVVYKKQPVAEEIKQYLNKEKGSPAPNKDKIGKLTKAQVREIAEKKMCDMNTTKLESAMRNVEGTARSMGVDIID